ncbi:hypothetical protein [Tenacibaculum finnmarkense]|uniref:hypothetical protein n=2 Tax=Tenacibaculum finnmarkense TaxID=2781243 RepID=UPI001EFA7754|nr:hypothetical protein [Tenacibaculum finnmarkense]MCM8863441.1 hypothetical protein [Tenacibaculum finnmarkense genomovar finnmarkense]
MVKIGYFVMLILFLCCSCMAQHKKQKKMKERVIESMLSKTIEYKSRPVYSCQVNKNNCRLILEVEGSTDSRFIENNGESMMLPLNPLLIKSGLQKIIVKIYPFEGQEYIDAGANVGLTFYNAPDKDSNLTDYKKIATFSLPKNIGEQKLPYYESVIEFDVTVPFNYSKELKESQNLKNITDIESKVVDKYRFLRNLGIDSDDASFKKELSHGNMRYINNMYSTSLSDIEGVVNGISALCEHRLKSKTIQSIENYDIEYYANGKMVALLQKNFNPILYTKGSWLNSEGELTSAEVGQRVFLYMPKDSNELKLW